jgi:ferric-dicitrate binding protein FerR (iron transport regulator)
MSDDLDPRILAKWVAGRLDPGERETLERWPAADPAHAAQLHQARELWRRAGDARSRLMKVRRPIRRPIARSGR